MTQAGWMVAKSITFYVLSVSEEPMKVDISMSILHNKLWKFMKIEKARASAPH